MGLELLERFQAALVGFVGFVGVTMTLISNARLATRRDRKLRAHENETLVRALSAELQSHYRRIASIAEQMREEVPTESNLVIPVLPAMPIFDANLGRLGVLDGDQVSSVLEAYTLLKELDRTLVLFSKPHESGFSASSPEHK